MLKYRLIRTYLAVCCAVCVSYAGARAAWGLLWNGDAGTAEPTNVTASVDESKLSPVTVVREPPSTVAAEQPVGDTTLDEPERDGGASAGEGDAAQGAEDAAQEAVEQQVEEQQVEEQQVEEQSAPSLAEYLSQFTCGNCRRNCSLDHPRCHNGSRLAELKAQEYAALYGAV